jgi:intracellular sulfur oxidation DsrE/DsrF family protein
MYDGNEEPGLPIRGLPGVGCPTNVAMEESTMNLKHFTYCFLSILLLVFPATQVWSDESGENWERVVFQLDETRNARWAMMLARSYLDDRPKAKIVFVAFGPGIDFLMDGAKDKRGNPFDYAVLNLAERGVDFRICAATLDARDIDRKSLLDVATVVPSGISEIARLQLKEGYAYLKP